MSKTIRSCRICGCTDDHACAGGCFWVSEDLCSACLGEMSAPRFESGFTLIKEGRCPKHATQPLACWGCMEGHATECHYPKSCSEAQCSHYWAEINNAGDLIGQDPFH